MLPIVYARSKDVRIDLGKKQILLGKKLLYKPRWNPRYDFHRRDMDILQIEKKMLSLEDSNILLVQGMGGVGKSTLLEHLAIWWQKTGLVDKVYYVGYDLTMATVSVISRDIVKEWEPGFLDQFDRMASRAQVNYVVELLKLARHLLILDNLEAISGEFETRTLKMNEEDKEGLRDFLSGVVGGQTLVLLGSRDAERWLARGTFERNFHVLEGLDDLCAKSLVDAVLRRNGLKKYRSDENVVKIMELVANYPLPLIVLLAELDLAAPAEF